LTKLAFFDIIAGQRRNLTMQLFNAILETQTLKEAATRLGTTIKHIQHELRELVVRHVPRQRYKEAVQDFLNAGGPYQYDLFRDDNFATKERKLSDAIGLEEPHHLS